MSDEIQVQVSKAACPFQIDGFPEDAQRSVEGALHFRPGALRSVTSDELKFIQTRFPGYYDQLRIVQVEKPKPPKPVSSPSTTKVEKPSLSKRRAAMESKTQARRSKSTNREDDQD